MIELDLPHIVLLVGAITSAVVWLTPVWRLGWAMLRSALGGGRAIARTNHRA